MSVSPLSAWAVRESKRATAPLSATRHGRAGIHSVRKRLLQLPVSIISVCVEPSIKELDRILCNAYLGRASCESSSRSSARRLEFSSLEPFLASASKCWPVFSSFSSSLYVKRGAKKKLFFRFVSHSTATRAHTRSARTVQKENCSLSLAPACTLATIEARHSACCAFCILPFLHLFRHETGPNTARLVCMRVCVCEREGTTERMHSITA